MPIMARTRAQSYDPYSDWGVNPKGQQVNAMGQRKIIGFSPDRAPSRGFGGLNEHYARQAYDGSPKAIEDYASEARKSGELVKTDGGRMLDTWENRGFKTHLSDKNPYAQPAGPVAPVAPSLPPGAPSADNMAFAEKAAPRDLEDRGNPAPPRPVAGRTLDNQDWANKPAPKGGGGAAAPAVPGSGGNDEPGSDEAPPEEPTDEGGGDPGEGGGSSGGPTPQPKPEDPNLLKVPLPIVNRAAKPPPMPSPMGNDNSGQAAPGYQGITDSGWGQSAAESAAQSRPSPQPVSNRVSANPYMARADNVAQAKAAGTFDNIRNGYNRDNMEKGYVMNPAGDIIQNKDIQQDYARSQLQPMADEIAARRDFARGEAPVVFTDPNESPTADEMNPQPRRAVKVNPYGTATATFGGPPTTGGTMEDPLTGATVPIKQWTNDQSAVQATKYGPGAAQAGADYLNPKRIAASTEPLGQDDAEQYRAIARGGKIPRSSKA